MADDDRDEKLSDTANYRTDRPEKKRRRWGWKLGLLGIFVVPLVLAGLWVAITLSYTYSEGTRTGYIQKLSEKGWICKTWEGELAMATMPGVMPEIWKFTIRDDAVARQLAQMQGKRVTLHYDEHKGVPTTCFGETQYYVKAAQPAPGP